MSNCPRGAARLDLTKKARRHWQNEGDRSDTGPTAALCSRSAPMSEQRLRLLSLQDLKVLPSYGGGGLTLAFHGTADMRHAGALQAFLQSVHLEAGAIRATEVAADLRELSFMASSCFKCFVSWLNSIRDGSGPIYKVRFIANAQHHWQKRSLDALRCFAPVYTVVEGVSMPPSARR
jgi:hypothetical protein